MNNERNKKQTLNFKNMKTFLISSAHTIYIDSYSEGETEYINSYYLKDEIKAYNYKEAITKYLKNSLYLNLDINNCELDEDTNCFETSCLIDSENIQPSEYDVKQWEKDKITLYSNNIQIYVSEIIEIDLKL